MNSQIPNEVVHRTVADPKTSNHGLTKTEAAVLTAVNLGMTNCEIAEMLVVSYETIRTHCAHIKRKVGDQWPIRRGAGHGGRHPEG